MPDGLKACCWLERGVSRLFSPLNAYLKRLQKAPSLSKYTANTGASEPMESLDPSSLCNNAVIESIIVNEQQKERLHLYRIQCYGENRGFF